MFRSDQQIPLIEHIRELRSRVFICFGVFIGTSVIGYLTFPLWNALLMSPFDGETFHSFTIQEAFILRIKHSMLLGFLYASPVILYETVAFIFPALSGKERRVVLTSLAGGIILFLGGILYSYEFVLPVCIQWLSRISGQAQNVELTLNYSRNISFALQILLAFGLVFQCPIVLFVLIALKLVRKKTLIIHSRVVIVIAFVVSAILTPPDVISQIALAFPLVGLFFITIGLAYIFKVGE